MKLIMIAQLQLNSHYYNYNHINSHTGRVQSHVQSHNTITHSQTWQTKSIIHSSQFSTFLVLVSVLITSGMWALGRFHNESMQLRCNWEGSSDDWYNGVHVGNWLLWNVVAQSTCSASQKRWQLWKGIIKSYKHTMNKIMFRYECLD